MSDEELSKAKEYLLDRAETLLKDVRYCILRNEGTEDWPAPIPALLFCFSTIDLFGSLYGGDAVSTGGISVRSRSYMKDVVGYTEKEAWLLQKVFRHKIVHLAQPAPEVSYEGEKYTWMYHHNDRGTHLATPINPYGGRFFNVSIYTLAEDIRSSLDRKGGFFDQIDGAPGLQTKYKTAFEQLGHV